MEKKVRRLSTGKAQGEISLGIPGVFARFPETGDEANALEYLKGLVEEDAMIANNRANTLEEEAKWLAERLISISEGKVVHYFAVERKSGKIIGSCEAKLGKMRESHVATMGIGVSKDFRGRGLGKKLLALTLEGARRIGAKRATLSVFSINRPALGLYRKMGFRPEGRLRGHLFYKGKYVDKLLMSKDLSSALPFSRRRNDEKGV